MIILYKCDPDKNTNCKKRICFARKPCMNNPCRGTRNVDYAVKDKTGKPIVIYLRYEDHDFADGSEVEL